MRFAERAEQYRDAQGDIDWLAYWTAEQVEGFLHPLELDRLVKLATDKDVLEVGAYKGLSAWGMAHTAKHVTSVDTFGASDNGQTQLGRWQENRYTTLAQYDQATREFPNVARVPVSSERAIELIPGDFDMIFIDAMHDYENVKADALRWWPRVRAGGVMALHDYGHDAFGGVKQALDELFGPAAPEDVTVTLRVVRRAAGAARARWGTVRYWPIRATRRTASASTTN